VTYLLISHDLAVVDHLCDEVIVLHQGASSSRAPRALFRHPQHPYTQAPAGCRAAAAQPGRNRRRKSTLSNEQILGLAQSEP
jgi:ABC-type oligopeptide transport system ATPase subunit